MNMPQTGTSATTILGWWRDGVFEFTGTCARCHQATDDPWPIHGFGTDMILCRICYFGMHSEGAS